MHRDRDVLEREDPRGLPDRHAVRVGPREARQRVHDLGLRVWG